MSVFFAALHKLDSRSSEMMIAIKADLHHYKIPVLSINYVHSSGGYLTVHTDDRPYTFYGEIKRFIEKLPSTEFSQCHRSYIVNIGRVTSYYDATLMINEEEIPVSKQHKKEVANLLKG